MHSRTFGETVSVQDRALMVVLKADHIMIITVDQVTTRGAVLRLDIIPRYGQGAWVAYRVIRSRSQGNTGLYDTQQDARQSIGTSPRKD